MIGRLLLLLLLCGTLTVVAAEQMLTLDAALVQALERNRELRVQRLTPERRVAEVERAQAAFSPTVSATAEVGHGAETFAPPIADASASGRTWSTRVGLDQTLPTGTTFAVDASTGREISATSGALDVSRANMTVSQALLRGAGLDVNLVTVRQARLEVQASQYELRGFVETLAAGVESAYWRYALERARVAIVDGSVTLAQRQLDEAREAVDIGKLAGIQLAAAAAELALRREDAIAARAAQDEARLRLVDLIGAAPSLQPAIAEAAPAPIEADQVEDRVALSRRLRPELNQARLRLRQGDLELVRTRNGMLPKLDAFVALGGTGYADTIAGSLHGEVGRRDDVSVGVRFSQTLGRRDADAAHAIAAIDRQQAEAALANLERLIELEVRLAQSALTHAYELVEARSASAQAQQAKFDAEVEKLRSGASTTLAVAQAERDLLASRLAAASSQIDVRIALAELHRADGSLLARHGLSAPGGEPER